MSKIKWEEIQRLSALPKLQELVSNCIILSLNGRKERMAEWNKLDRAIKAFKDREEGNGGQRLDETKKGQDYIDDVNVPLLFLIWDTISSQLNKIFFSKENVFQFDGQTEEDLEGAKKMTKVVATAGRRFKNTKELKDCLRNAVKYGEAYVTMGWKSFKEKQYGTDIAGARSALDRTTLSGCAYTNMSPYRMLTDPACPPDKLDKARWIGHYWPISKYDLMRMAEIPKEMVQQWNWLFSKTSDPGGFPKLLNMTHFDNNMSIGVDLYVDLIPSEVGLGDSTEPEVWHLVVCGFDTVLLAEKAELPTDKYPYYSVCPDGDGYDLQSISRLDLIKDLQSLYNWLINSHMYAVRKGVDGDYVWDPMLIDGADVEEAKRNPRPSNWIRLNQNAWGMLGATEKGIHRLDSSNNTNNYMQEASMLLDMMKLLSGATEVLIGGEDNPSSRRTAEEIATVKQSAGERMMNLAGVIHDTFLFPLGYATAKYTQAKLDHDVMLRLTDKPGGAEAVGWQEMLVEFDLVVGSGFLAFDENALQQSWQTFLSTVFQNPQLMTAFNLVEVLKTWATTMGIKDIEQYVSQAGVAALKEQAMGQVASNPAVQGI